VHVLADPPVRPGGEEADRPDDRDDHHDQQRDPVQVEVPAISTYTPNCATRPMTRAPVMFRMVWIASSTTVMTRIVRWLVGSRFQPNQLCVSAVT
jgi:hypothetical protein